MCINSDDLLRAQPVLNQSVRQLVGARLQFVVGPMLSGIHQRHRFGPLGRLRSHQGMHRPYPGIRQRRSGIG